MGIVGQEAALSRNKIFATAAIALWLLFLAFVSGPARWEFQHSYAHWIEGAEADLPALTRAVSLPILGLGQPGLATLFVQCVFWGVVWLTPCSIVLLVWRYESRQSLVEGLLLGGIGYVAALALLAALVMLGFWLPFALL